MWILIFVIWYLFIGMAFSCHYIDRWDDYKALKRCIATPLWLPICAIAFIGTAFYVFSRSKVMFYEREIDCCD